MTQKGVLRFTGMTAFIHPPKVIYELTKLNWTKLNCR